MTEGIPEKADFEKALDDWFREAELEESPFVDIRADELHSRIGDYPGPFHRMATCCEVMYEHYQPSVDKIMQFPPKARAPAWKSDTLYRALPPNPGKIKPRLSRRRKRSLLSANIATALDGMSATFTPRNNPVPRPAAAKKRTACTSFPAKPGIIRIAKPAKAAAPNL
jgi:hypothetical protein